MGGPWDKFKSAGAPGPWTKFQGGGTPSPAPEEPGILDKIKNNLGENLKSVDAFGTGAGNTMTLGMLPQIEAGLDTAGDTVKNAVTGEGVGNLDDIAKAYQGNKDQVLAHQEQLQKDRPLAYGAGSLGAVFSAPVQAMGKAAAILPNAALNATGVAESLPALSKFIKAGAVAGELGLAANPGDVKGQSGGLQLDQRLSNAKYAVPFGLAGEGVVQGIENSPEWVDSIRRWMASKQLGANTSQMKQLLKELPGGEGTRLDRIENFMDKNGMLNMGTHFADVEDKAGDIAKNSGQKLEGLYNAADQATPTSHAVPEIAQKLEDTRLHGPDLASEFIGQEAARLTDTKNGPQIIKTLQNELGTPDAEGALTQMGPDVSLKRLWKFRQSVDEDVNFAAKQGNATLARSYVNLRNFLNDKIMSRVGAVDEANGTSMMPDITDANQTYSDANMVKNITNNTKAREYQKLVPGMVGLVGGAGAGVYAHEHGEGLPKSILTGLATGLALRGARAIAPAVTYRGATALEPYLQQGAQALKQNPGAGGPLLTIPWLNMQRENQ